MGLKTGLSLKRGEKKRRNERKGERLFGAHEVIKNCRCEGTRGAPDRIYRAEPEPNPNDRRAARGEERRRILEDRSATC